METLLQKAKSVNLRGNKTSSIDMEEIELAISWAKGEITANQVMVAIDSRSNGGTMSRLAQYLKEAMRLGFLKEEKKL